MTISPFLARYSDRLSHTHTHTRGPRRNGSRYEHTVFTVRYIAVIIQVFSCQNSWSWVQDLTPKDGVKNQNEVSPVESWTVGYYTVIVSLIYKSYRQGRSIGTQNRWPWMTLNSDYAPICTLWSANLTCSQRRRKLNVISDNSNNKAEASRKMWNLCNATTHAVSLCSSWDSGGAALSDRALLVSILTLGDHVLQTVLQHFIRVFKDKFI